MTTLAEYINKPSSNKEILCHVEPSQKLNVWALDSGAIYIKTVTHYVIGVKQDDTQLTKVSSSSLSSGEFFFDSSDFTLYVRMSDDSSPDDNDTIANYRLFLSSIPYNLPFDLESGEEVHYEPLIQSRSFVKFEIDEEQKGISLESSYIIRLENTGGFFDEIYDQFIFEEKNVEIFAWSPEILLSDKRKVFSGFIKNKTFNEKN